MEVLGEIEGMVKVQERERKKGAENKVGLPKRRMAECVYVRVYVVGVVCM